MASYKTETQRASVLSAIESFYSVVEELAGECQDGFDSATEGAQNSDRGQDLEATISELESIGELPELPAAADARILGDLGEVEYSVRVYGGKYRGQEARHVRAENACSAAEAGLGKIEEWIEELEEAHEGSRDEEDQSIDGLSSDLQQWVDEVRDHVGAVQAIEAWTMRG